MEATKDVPFLSLCLSFLLLFECVPAQEGVDAKCKESWYVSLSEDIVVSWSGEQRDAEVVAHIITQDRDGRDCDSNQTLIARFRDQNVKLPNPCSNAFYTVTVILVCDQLRLQQTIAKCTPPDAPPVVRLKPTNTSIAVEWSPPHGRILRYEVICQSEDRQRDPSLWVERTSNTSWTFFSLIPYTEYRVTVSARNEEHWSRTKNASARTHEGVPSAPKNLMVKEVTTDRIALEWDTPVPDMGPISRYDVWWIEDRMMEPSRDSCNVTSYLLQNLDPYTVYHAAVHAVNSMGAGPSANVTEKTKLAVPDPPELRVLRVTNTTVTVQWKLPEKYRGPDPSYRLRWKPDSKEEYDGTTTVFEASRAGEYTKTGLVPFTEYQVQIRALNEAGFGNWSRWIETKTLTGIPSEPLNVSVLARTSNSFEIQWVAPEHMNAPYVIYVINWRMARDPDEAENATVDDTSFDEAETTSYIVGSLESYFNYSVKVCAKSDAGKGKFTEPLLVQTMAGVPGIPTRAKAVAVKSTEMTIQWSPPEITRGPLEGYELRWGVEGTEGSRYHTTENSYQALGLRPYTGYFFEVSAKSEGGAGEPKLIYKRTNVSTPSVPRHLEVISVSDHYILLQWTTPENPNAPLVQYGVEWKEVSGLTKSYNTNATSYRIQSLDPFTNYSTRVSATTAAGRGPSTEWIYVRTETKDVSTAVISGSVVGTLVVVLVIGGAVLFFYLRTKNAQQCQPSEKSPKISPTTVAFQLEPLPYSKKISVDHFDEHVLKLMSNSYYELAQEFEQLRRESPGFPADEAKKNDNLAKNRWVKILPFDHTRVKLLPVGDEVEPDYINASFVQGDAYLLEYIAAQGPLQNTVDDFWRMVWQESIFLIVMLTQCVERAKQNCEQYWPQPGTSTRYGTLEVRAVSENITPTFTQRLLLVTQDGKQRHVIHLHYTKWPVSGCPKSPDEFLTFVQTVRSQVACTTTGPLLVHCSAGIGRTGTFIAVDKISQQLSKRQCDEVDVYGIILEMRRCRPNLVQTEEQYYFIYLCVQRLIQQKQLNSENDYGGGIYAN